MRPNTIPTFAAGIITGSLITATIAFAAPAKADTDPTADAYATLYSQAVCSTLDDYPTFDGIIGIGQAVMEDGLTARQAGQVIGLSVANTCPRHATLLLNFAAAVNRSAA